MLLLDPNVVFFGICHWPDQALPEVPAMQGMQQATSGPSPEMASSLAQAVHESRERGGLPSISAAIARDG
ncbi:MAG: hypothetical protein ABI650_11710, partial [Dokdonella sp.]